VSEQIAIIEHELCLTRIQLSRALRAEAEWPGAHPMLVFSDIIDELLGRIEQLVVTRAHVLAAIRRHDAARTLQ
jgi:hypothetical protein